MLHWCIPRELGNLTRLRYLNREAEEGRTYNKVDDAKWIFGLSSLKYLFMDHVNFFGVNNVMQSLNKLHHLENVSLFGCNISSIPESLPFLNFTFLIVMDVRSNMFHNTSIQEWLVKIPHLHHLSMRYCEFTGTICSSVGNATSPQFLQLSNNKRIFGDMPREFGDLCNLQWLNLKGTFVRKSSEDFTDALCEI